MYRVKITALRQTEYQDLVEKYENPIEFPCDVEVGTVFIADGWEKPRGLCDAAWNAMSPYVMTLAHGGKGFYDCWLKNPRSAIVSCSDGLRPMTFLLETLPDTFQVPQPKKRSETK